MARMRKLNFRKREKKVQEVFSCDDPTILLEAEKTRLEYQSKLTPIKDDEEYISLYEYMEDLMDKDYPIDEEVETIEILQDRLLKYHKTFSEVIHTHYTNWQGKDCNPDDCMVEYNYKELVKGD